MSIRDHQTVSFAPGLDRAKAPEGRWEAVTDHVSILMGANASGKTNMLEAMNFGLRAIRESATSWREHDDAVRLPHHPFRLNKDSRRGPSFFEWDFVIEGIRYVYGFEMRYDGVQSEWLSRVPAVKWSTVFDREIKEQSSSVSWNSTVVPRTLQRSFSGVSDRELIMSVALRDRVDVLGPVVEQLVHSIGFLPSGSRSEDHRINYLVEQIRHGTFKLDDVSQLMLAADTGIKRVELDETRIPSDILDDIKSILGVLSQAEDNENTQDSEQESRDVAARYSDEQIEDIAYNFIFVHQGSDGEQRLNLAAQSAGTKSWLSIAPMILHALRRGGIVIADELDSSLHNNILFMVVKLFADPDININGAQLWLTSHNTNLLEQRRRFALRPRNYWFAEKDGEGQSVYYCLDDFDKHEEANYEKRYLSGRYGAIPDVSPSIVTGLVQEKVIG
ncbi:AAA family ATPase [Corynebacterium cystitidis]|uniref:AAA family ATPase n=1 Tax=Corynebacterium cystitidis TaxID=35757 RepID=UPI00211E21FD|nr:ATP-binding protein [Corynebacterium cystitidis]